MSKMSELHAIKDEVYDFLDGLRESGSTNMFGAGPFVEAAFDLNQHEARFLVSEWMRTFSSRNA